MGTVADTGDRASHEQLPSCERGSQRAWEQLVERLVGHDGGRLSPGHRQPMGTVADREGDSELETYMRMLVSQHRALWSTLALVIQVGCDVEPPDVHDDDTDGAVTGAGETLDVWATSGTDDAGDSSEDGGEAGGGSGGESGSETGDETGGEPPPPPEEPDNSCLENLPAPDSQDKVWIAAGHGGSALRSTDGVNWDPIEIGGMGRVLESASVGSTFVLAALSDGELFVSDDGGLTWVLAPSPGLQYMEGVGDLFLGRDFLGTTSYWSADGKIWHEAQGVAARRVYALGPAGILSGPDLDSSVTLSVDGKVWSELLPTMGWEGDTLQHLVGRGDQYLAWSDEFPPYRIHSSVDGLTWTTSHIKVGRGQDDTHDVRWNGAQYVLIGSQYDVWLEEPIAYHSVWRSCNGRVWGNGYELCHSTDWGGCLIDFASTAAMTVVVRSWTNQSGDSTGASDIFYSADLVTWGSIEGVQGVDPALYTVVVGDP
jgi:hypothetical protein